LSIAALILLLVPIVGLVWPVPLTPPMNATPYIYGAYLLIGGIIVFVRRRTKTETDSVRKYLEETVMAPAASAASMELPGDATPALA
jgi:uncharacterized membrane protein HdeD (DUF308 family)